MTCLWEAEKALQEEEIIHLFPLKISRVLTPKRCGKISRWSVPSVTGLRIQITHGVNGYLADETKTAAYTFQLLEDRALWRRPGENAHETVRQRFLFPEMILDYLQALAQVAHSFLCSKDALPTGRDGEIYLPEASQGFHAACQTYALLVNPF